MIKRPDNIALLFFFSAGIAAAFACYSNLYCLIIYPAAAALFFLSARSKLPVIVFITGSAIFALHNHGQFMIRDMMEGLEEKETVVYGRISELNEYILSSSVVINSDSIRISGRTAAIESKFTAYLNRTGLTAGDSVTVSGKLQPFEAPLNKYETDRRLLSTVKDTVSEIKDASLISLRKNEAGMRYFINRLQSKAEDIFDRRLSFTSGGFLTAIITGDKGRLEEHRIKEFADSGTIHLLAVSGLHVGFVVLILGIFNSFFHLKKWPYLIINSCALIFYAVFTGGSPSVIRAVLMAIILMLSKPLKRKLRAADVIGTAGIVSLSYDPNQIFMTGFILSFAAVLSIVLIHQPLSEMLNRHFKTENLMMKKIREGLLLSASVTIGLLPFVLYLFGRYNFISILSNLVLIPLTAAAFMSGILIIAADKMNLAAEFFSDTAEFIVKIIMYITGSTAEKETFTLHGSTDALVTASLILFLAAVFYLKDLRYKTSVVFVSTVMIGISFFLIESDPVLYVFKTSSGQSAVLRNCGENILFASGVKRSDITRIINPYLSRTNVRQIDYFITPDEWFKTEEIVNYLQVPVINIVGGRDHEYLAGHYRLLDFESLGGTLKTAGAEISPAGSSYRIGTGVFSCILDSSEKDKGREIVFTKEQNAEMTRN
ncbi:MAG: ComEC/Rec2 family competence protein [Candidatus Delongbacteria bacterium]|nr:ComEC/Rec2 family competence protein [Candidatus Delongbacteria bacterium]